MRTFIGTVFGKSEKVEEKEINLDKVSYFEKYVRNDIEKEVMKCNEKAKLYLQKHGTIKGFECQFEIRNCLDKDETLSLTKTISPEIKLIRNYD